MIKRLITSLFLAFIAISASAQVDSLALAKMNEMLDEYLQAIATETPEAKIQEVDFLIETCTDSLLRQAVAERLYDHFVTSQVMCDENVAIHMYDRWFKNHEIEMSWDGALLHAAFFAEYNRNSLVGNPAPEVTLANQEGEYVLFPDLPGDARAVLFFYEVDCYKCRAEMAKLKEYLPTVDFPLEFYAVYTGDFEGRWRSCIENDWNIGSEYVTIHHFWDPEFLSNFQMMYGLTETPRMYLLGKDGTILGRRLNTDALSELLAFASLQEALYKRCPIGSKVPDIKLSGTMLKGRKAVEGTYRIRKADYVMFYSPTCAHCEQEIEAARNTAGKKLLVNMDELGEKSPETVKELLDTFDLSVLPHIIHLKRGKVLEKYISFVG